MADSESVESRLEECARAAQIIVGDDTIQRLFGRKSKKENAGKRRIVWIGPGGDFEAPRQAGGREVPGATPNDTSYRVTTCFDRMERVEAHIYAEDRAAAEGLMEALLGALKTAFGTSFQPKRYEFPTQAPHKDGDSLGTELCILYGTIRMPVPMVIAPLKQITGTDHTCGTLDDQGNFTPQQE